MLMRILAIVVLATAVCLGSVAESRTISGGPDWTNSDRYDITALTPGESPTTDQQMAMLRSLLAERFKLKMHTEPKEQPVYALTANRTALDLKESTAAPDEQPILVNRIFPNRVVLPARNATMAQFAAMMGRAVLNRVVVDKTGLSGRYDFDLEW